jgi:hypothetical protein
MCLLGISSLSNHDSTVCRDLWKPTRFSVVLSIPKIGVRPYARMSTPARDPSTSKVTYLFIYIGAKI